MQDSKLAVNGGEKVRTESFPPYYPGAMMYDRKEADLAARVLAAHSPFRFYGPDLQGTVKEFEREFSAALQVKHSLGVTSGTAAVICALKAAGIGPGDKVVVPACTFIASAGAVVCAGAVPVFAEIDDSLSMDPDCLEDIIDENVRAIMPVPILGNPCRIDRLMEIARRKHVLVIEDAAQSCGATYHGKPVGTFGDVNAFSLQMNKILTTGEGGVVAANDEKLYERAVRYHDQGMYREKEGFLAADEKADIFIGQNYRMSEITGAVALEQIKKLPEMLRRMRAAKAVLKAELRGVKGFSFRRINDEQGDAGNAMILLLDDAARVPAFLRAVQAEGIPLGRLYNGEPVFMQPQLLYQRTADANGFPFNTVVPPVRYSADMCPRSTQILRRNVTMMIGTTWTDKDTDDVIRAVKKVAAAIL
ncbi:MAG TPA: DegT/DnrJ/EryC1/StrS family aminotransferase [Candidatus Limiplasma sp.]|nr:DegT/DnrJ/EryC1/StrS family aminotransferase [Candidatus Limiplasma sp.]